MEILVIPGYFGFGRRDGGGLPQSAGVFFRDQAVALARAGHETTLMYVHFDEISGVHYEVQSDQGLRSVYIHAAPWVGFNSFRRIALFVQGFRSLYRDGAPDVIHGHVFAALPILITLSALFRVPFVVTEHSSAVQRKTLGWFWRLIVRFGFSRAAAVLAVSDKLADAMAVYTKRAIFVIPNLVRSEFLDQEGKGGPKSDLFTFLSVGYCKPIKGWDLLITAFSRLDQVHAPSRLVLCGDTCQELVDLSNSLSVGDRVNFTGKLLPEAVPSLVNECDCHVMPSRLETFGIASIEALACGKPIIMTDTGAATSAALQETGIIVPVGDVAALASAMQRMTAHAGDFDADAIRAICRARFSEQAVVKQLEAVYKRVARGG